METLPSKRFESHSQSANGKRPFGVKKDKHGPCHGADFYKNDTLSRSQNPENDTLFSGTSPHRNPPPPGTVTPWLTEHTLRTKHIGDLLVGDLLAKQNVGPFGLSVELCLTKFWPRVKAEKIICMYFIKNL